MNAWEWFRLVVGIVGPALLLHAAWATRRLLQTPHAEQWTQVRDKVIRHEHTLYGNGLTDEVEMVRERTHPIPGHTQALAGHSEWLRKLEDRIVALERRKK